MLRWDVVGVRNVGRVKCGVVNIRVDDSLKSPIPEDKWGQTWRHYIVGMVLAQEFHNRGVISQYAETPRIVSKVGREHFGIGGAALTRPVLASSQHYEGERRGKEPGFLGLMSDKGRYGPSGAE